MINYLNSATHTFRKYKELGERAIAQINDDDLYRQANDDSNSVETIVKHMWGNMMSRWTDFLTTDGEKPWRQRDEEFEPEHLSREALMQKWEEGWKRLFDTLSTLSNDDLDKTVYIRKEAQTVLEAIHRQIAHYSYHVGQIVYLAKQYKQTAWNTLSMPRRIKA